MNYTGKFSAEWVAKALAEPALNDLKRRIVLRMHELADSIMKEEADKLVESVKTSLVRMEENGRDATNIVFTVVMKGRDND
jgi:hypothetical protein